MNKDSSPCKEHLATYSNAQNLIFLVKLHGSSYYAPGPVQCLSNETDNSIVYTVAT